LTPSVLLHHDSGPPLVVVLRAVTVAHNCWKGPTSNRHELALTFALSFTVQVAYTNILCLNVPIDLIYLR
jgi:hypothetical protein